MPRDVEKWEGSCYRIPDKSKTLSEKFFEILVLLMLFLLAMSFFVLGLDLVLYYGGN